MILRKAAFLLVLSLFACSITRFAVPASASSTIIVYPTQSIQKAINNATEGDTIFIKNGTYTQSLIIVNKTVTLLGENPEGTIIDGERADSVIFNVVTSNVKIINLTVQNTTAGPGPIGVNLAAVRSVEVSGCIIRDSGTGIRLFNSSSCRIEKNKIMQNTWYGIDLQISSSSNSIRDNLVANNPIGIQADDSIGQNMIYHNNFVDNSIQTAGGGLIKNKWDNGYPSGGNYWSDYSSGDSFNGIGQNLNGSDGIGDKPYPNIAYPYDSYPFMGEIRTFWAGKWGSDYYVWIASNSTDVAGFMFSNSTIPHLQFNVTGSGFLTYSCRVAVPKQLMWVDSPSEWQALVNYTIASPLVYDDAECTYLYLNYTYGILETSKNIQINGTHIIPETAWPLLIAMLAVLTSQAALMKRGVQRRIRA
jgi:parallel beta-helix repeat protein